MIVLLSLSDMEDKGNSNIPFSPFPKKNKRKEDKKVKKKRYLVFDTETSLKEGLTFNIGAAIADKKGNIGETFEFFIRETYLMIPFYPIPVNKEKIVNWTQFIEAFNELLEKTDCYTAYNLNFDKTAIQKTHKTITGENFIFPADKEFFCLWGASCETFMKQKQYKDWAPKTEKGNIQSKAETAINFINRYNQSEYCHVHSALPDCIGETMILKHIFRQKKKITRNRIIGSPWRIINKKGR